MQTTFPYDDVRNFLRTLYGDIRLWLTPTVYELGFGDFTASQQKTQTAPINANCDFLMLGVSGSCTGVPLGLFQLTDSSNSISLLASPAPLVAVASFPASVGACQHYPYWIGRNSAFIGQYSDSGAAITDLNVSLIGLNIRELQ